MSGEDYLRGEIVIHHLKWAVHCMVLTVKDGEEEHGEQAHHDTVGGDVGHVVLLAPHLTLVPDVLV